jgi:hypothetical protein
MQEILPISDENNSHVDLVSDKINETFVEQKKKAGSAVLIAVKTTETDSDKEKGRVTLSPLLSANGDEIEKIEHSVIKDQNTGKIDLASQTVVTSKVLSAESVAPIGKESTLEAVITEDTTHCEVHPETTTDSPTNLRPTIDDGHFFPSN